VTVSFVAPSADCMCGMATLAIVVSRICMIDAPITAMVRRPR
jgi:hypothetical protein